MEANSAQNSLDASAPVISAGSSSIASSTPMFFKKHFEINIIGEWQSDYVHFDDIRYFFNCVLSFISLFLQDSYF